MARSSDLLPTISLGLILMAGALGASMYFYPVGELSDAPTVNVQEVQGDKSTPDKSGGDIDATP